ncbi:MAG: hypothetical protein E6H06_18775 [Bacteroidetes bacterium]|nr:MAG: hypothetical protein E6H06_18775 [Bacteroidota bacterium]
MKTKIKNYGTIALFIAFGLLTTAASASGLEKDPPVAQLKYIGNIENQPVFQLDLNTAQEGYFLISIENKFGETLYSERIKAKVFTRKFRLDTETLSDDELRVEVRTSSNKKPEVFTINRNTRLVEEASVTKL